ncbi:hypothetical protein F4824DRAFT_274858 [Ustulina deusta]|nr:hypothetical protein F4824DRAFT_274858 [Ustulina deusta]
MRFAVSIQIYLQRPDPTYCLIIVWFFLCYNIQLEYFDFCWSGMATCLVALLPSLLCANFSPVTLSPKKEIVPDQSAVEVSLNGGKKITWKQKVAEQIRKGKKKRTKKKPRMNAYSPFLPLLLDEVRRRCMAPGSTRLFLSEEEQIDKYDYGQ